MEVTMANENLVIVESPAKEGWTRLWDVTMKS